MTNSNIPANSGRSPTSILAHQLGFLPNVRRFECEGAACVAVSLSGLHGAGREMMLDDADWNNVSTAISPWWQVVKLPGGEYVVCSNSTAIEIAKRTSKVRMLFLGRYLANPPAGSNVRFTNDNRLDLRRASLAVVTRSEHSRMNVAIRNARTMQRHAEMAAAMAQQNAQGAQQAA